MCSIGEVSKESENLAIQMGPSATSQTEDYYSGVGIIRKSPDFLAMSGVVET